MELPKSSLEFFDKVIGPSLGAHAGIIQSLDLQVIFSLRKDRAVVGRWVLDASGSRPTWTRVSAVPDECVFEGDDANAVEFLFTEEVFATLRETPARAREFIANESLEIKGTYANICKLGLINGLVRAQRLYADELPSKSVEKAKKVRGSKATR